MLAVVWHWWISLLLVVGSVALVIATIAGYLNKVTKPRYDPNKR